MTSTPLFALAASNSPGQTAAFARFGGALLTLAICALLAGYGAQAQAQTSASAGSTTVQSGSAVTLNFSNAEIDAVARTIAVITGRNVVVDPRVKGTMTLVTSSPVTPTQALRQFTTQLRIQGFALIEKAGLYLVLPEAEAKLQSAAVSASAVPAASGQIMTQIFSLNHETANNLVPVLRPLISPNNTINVNPGNNSLIITDYADNLQRIATIIAALDVANATGVEILRLQHAIATDLAPLVTRLIDSGGTAAGAQGQADGAYKTTLVAEPRSNSLILRAANPTRLALVRTLVEKLDQASFSGNSNGQSSATGNIYVVYLKNADASKLAVTLRAALAASSGSASGGGGSSSGIASVSGGGLGSSGSSGAGAGTGTNASMSGATTSALNSAQPSTGGQIQADPATNSLIITAPEPQYRQLRAVIDKLDARRAQVYVESLIAEVSTDKLAEFGVQFQGSLGGSGNNFSLLGTNFGVGGSNILGLSNGSATPSTGGNFAVGTQQGGVTVLGFLARFLERTGGGNVLSTPNILTLDNEEARIVVGQNVPFVTGQFTSNNSNSGSVNPFQTIERKDVGLTLRVKPQISENGTIKLQVYQEVSSVDTNSVIGLTTNKRSIESNVVVNDGAIVVLGGLLQDEYSGRQEKVPGLGDVPFFGNLFKGESRSRKKTNLMVFLRPVVVRDASSTESLSMDRYDLMRGIQKTAQPVASDTVPINSAPVMPAQREPTLPTSPAPMIDSISNAMPVMPITPTAPPAAPALINAPSVPRPVSPASPAAYR
jgi:general secretion pathway protein D